VARVIQLPPLALWSRRVRCEPVMYISAFNWYSWWEKSEQQICTWTATTSSLQKLRLRSLALLHSQGSSTPDAVPCRAARHLTSMYSHRMRCRMRRVALRCRGAPCGTAWHRIKCEWTFSLARLQHHHISSSSYFRSRRSSWVPEFVVQCVPSCFTWTDDNCSWWTVVNLAADRRRRMTK